MHMWATEGTSRPMSWSSWPCRCMEVMCSRVTLSRVRTRRHWRRTWWPKRWRPTRNSTATSRTTTSPGKRERRPRHRSRRWQRPWCGDRVSLEDMETVLEEHRESGQSVARILTARKLVTEADLMWGMAQEMGLDFVDLDTVGIDFAEAGTIPEATARYHNVVVIGNENGAPVVAASNPTDVFAMDDLRTIIGRPFIVVVATRTQISAYIGRVFNSGGDAADMAMEASLGFDGTSQDSSVDDIQAVTEEAPIVRYVNLLILQALN